MLQHHRTSWIWSCCALALTSLAAAAVDAQPADAIRVMSTWEVRAGRPELKMRDISLRAGIVPEKHVAESRSVLTFALNRLPASEDLAGVSLALKVQKTRGLTRSLPLEVRALAETAELATGDWPWVAEQYEAAPVIGSASVPRDIEAGAVFEIPLTAKGIETLQAAKRDDRRLTLVLATGDVPTTAHTAAMVWFTSNRTDVVDDRPWLKVTPAESSQTARPAAAPPSRVVGDTVLVRARDFQFTGGWQVSHVRGGRPLSVRESSPSEVVDDAMTVIDLPKSGSFHIWTRSIDYHSEPGRRRYQLLIDGDPAARESGGHGVAGWKWEKVDTRPLSVGQHVLGLHDTGRFYARCDAILLTTTDLDPNRVEMDELQRYLIQPAHAGTEQAAEVDATELQVHASDQDPEVASLVSDGTHIVFRESRDGEGRPMIRRVTRVTMDDRIVDLPAAPGGEELRLLYAPGANINTSNFYPTWDSEFSRYRFTVGGKDYEVAGEPHNPFLAGASELLVPRRVHDASADSVTLVYESVSGVSALGRWEFAPGERDARLTVTLDAPRSGYYSLIFAPFQGWNREAINAVLLPPVFQFQRVPESAQLVTSSLTPHPLAIVEAPLRSGGSPVSYAVVAEPARLPFRWSKNDNAPYGFSLINRHGGVQPVSFAPVLGLDDSRRESGQRIEATWRVLAMPGEWTDALAHASDRIMGVTDYRRPYRSSLTDAVFRMFDLMGKQPYGGWDARLKGFYNIEAPGGVTQASPLMLLAAARLTRDEAFYEQLALPTLEYVLSRDNFHFAVTVPADDHSILTERDTRLGVPNRRFATDFWHGADALLGGANRWMRDLALPDGRVRTLASVYPGFTQHLAAHRLAPEQFPIEGVFELADDYVARHVRGELTRPLGIDPHYNVAFHPHWWDLVNLYDITGESRFLNAAEEGGYHTIAGIWSHPVIPDGDITIHPDGSFGAASELLIWHGWEEFSLGSPRRPGDTPAHQVPAWLVSQVGLGFEQPVTYFRPRGGMMMTLMVSWAGHLERLADRTGNEIFRTYARNAIIGRWSNWPGYYLNGFTDLFHDPDYPRKGPDVTRLYYHHIPVHLAFTLDFLVAQMESRSGHRIVFPWVEQRGYAQFTNRIYGAEPGTFYGDHRAELWLDRDLVTLDTHNVNHLTARGTDRFWIVLMNELDEPTDVRVKVNHAMAGTTAGAPWLRYTNRDQPQRITTPLSEAPVTVPGKGLVSIALDASPQSTADLQPVVDGHVVRSLPDPWDELHAFRIRSPFGGDALYVVATGHPEAGSRARIDIDNHAWRRREVDRYPYEMTVYPWAYDQDMRFTFTGLNADGSKVDGGEVLLRGNR